MLDEYMLERIKHGNKEDLKQLFYSYSRKVFGTAYLILKDKDFAEDAVQETFIQVYKKIHSLNSAFAFESWLYKITVNCCLTLMKKNKTSTMITTDEEYIATTIDLYKSQDSPEKSYLKRESCTELLKLIRSLPPNQHIPLILFYYNELSVKEIAEIMGCPQNTIKSRLLQGRAKLKDFLSEDALNEIGGVVFENR